MFVSIHIPKTAGTSLGNVFDYSSGRRVFWDYDESYRFAQELQPEIRDNIDFIKSYFKFIHGHFYYSKYAEILKDAKFLTCVRHPVDRIVSQYNHVAYSSGGTDWRIPLIREGKMNVVEYARTDKNISSAMARHLMGRPLKEYDQVFVTERLQEGLNVFSKKFDFRLVVGAEHTNAGEKRMKTNRDKATKVKKVSDDERGQLYNLCVEDREIYIEACEIATKEKNTYLGK